MANDKKHPTPAPSPALEAPADVREAVVLERIAIALERLAGVFAPVEFGSVAGRSRRECAKGHGMQPTDDYCQACFNEMKAPKSAIDAGAP